jgi:hypothetical protein
MGDARRGAKSHPGHTGMRGYDFTAVAKLLEVHGAVSHHLLLGTRKRDRSYAVVSVQETLSASNVDVFPPMAFS